MEKHLTSKFKTPNGICNRNKHCLTMVKVLILFVILSTYSIISIGAICTWNGTVGNFSDATKWSGGVVPGAVDSVVIGAGTVTITSTTFIESLRLDGGTLALQNFTLNITKYTYIASGTITATTSLTTGTLICTGNYFQVHGGIHSANFVVSCEQIHQVNNTTFNGTVSITKTGINCNSSGGNNTYNKEAIFTMLGSCGWHAANGGDVFNKPATFRVGNGAFRISVSSFGTVTFKDTVYFESLGTGDIWFGNDSQITLSDNAVLIAQANKFTSGNLQIRNVTQNNATINDLRLSEASYLDIRNCTLTGSLNSTSYACDFQVNSITGNVNIYTTDQLNIISNIINGSNIFRYNYASIYSNAFSLNPGATTTIIKRKYSTTISGGMNPSDLSCGGNIFHGVTYLTDSTSGQGLYMEGTTAYGPTTYHKDVYMNNAGVSTSKFAQAGHTTYNGNIYFSVSNRNHQVLQIGNENGTGTATVAADKAFFTTGVTNKGYISLNYITQLGNAHSTIITTDSAGLEIRTSTLGGALTYIGGTASWVTIKVNSTFKDNVYITTSNGSSGTGNFTASAYIHSSTFEKSLAINTTRFSIRNCLTNTLSGTTIITKTGNGDDGSNGGNTFNGITTVNNNSSGTISMANSFGGDTYGNDLTLNVTSSGRIMMSHSVSYTSNFNGHIFVNGQGTGDIEFGDNTAGGASILANAMGITNTTAYTGGRLRISRLTQTAGVTNAPHVLTFTGAARCAVKDCIFEGNFTFTGLSTMEITNSIFHRNTEITCLNLINIRTSTFNSTNATFGTTFLTRSGSTSDNLYGGNVFKGPTTVINSATGSGGDLTFATTSGDAFQSTLTLNNSGLASIRLAQAGTNTFNNIFVNSSSGNGIYICENGVGNASINTGASINNGSGIFSSGILYVRNTTQNGAAANIFNTTANGDLSIVTSTIGGDWTSNISRNAIVASSTLQRNFILTAASINMNGSTTNTVASTTTTITKTGSVSDVNNGGNNFGGISTITNNGTGSFGWGASNPEVFATNATFVSNNTGTFSIPYSSTGTTFGGTTTFNKNTGFTGTIHIVRNASSATFNGPVVINNHANAGLITICDYTGGTATFNGSSSFNNLSTGGTIRICQASGTASVFNGAMSFSNTSSQGVYFGNSGNGGTTALSDGSGRSLSASTFDAGNLSITNFTQLGSTANQSMTLSGTAALTLGPSVVFNALVNFSSPQLFLNGGIYNNSTTLEKSGATDNNSIGGNIFNGTTTITNNGSGYERLASATADNFLGNVTFNGAGTGTLQVAHNGQNNFQGHVSCDRSLIWNGSTGVAYFRAGNIQNLGGAFIPIVIPRLTVDKSSNYVNLTAGITVSNTLTLTTNYIELNGQTLTISNPSGNAVVKTAGWVRSERLDNNSRVMWQIGSTTGDHIFPFGKNTTYRDISFNFNLTGGNAGNVTLSTYATAPDNAINRPITPETVVMSSFISTIDNEQNMVDRFWQITKDGVSGTATITFTYADDERPLSGDRETGLKAFRYNTTTNKWTKGIPNQTQDIAANTVTVAGLSTFSPWTLIMPTSPLPLQFLSLNINAAETAALVQWETAHEMHTSNYFIERSIDGIHFSEIGSMNPANRNEANVYHFRDPSPLNGTGYYRIKAVGVNGEIVYSYLKDVTFDGVQESITIYPNPTLPDNINLIVNQKENNDVSVSIYNPIGVKVYSKTFTALEGSVLTALNVENDLPSGTYMVVVKTAHDTHRKNIIIR